MRLNRLKRLSSFFENDKNGDCDTLKGSRTLYIIDNNYYNNPLSICVFLKKDAKTFKTLEALEAYPTIWL